jgi:hypothetical protein
MRTQEKMIKTYLSVTIFKARANIAMLTISPFIILHNLHCAPACQKATISWHRYPSIKSCCIAALLMKFFLFFMTTRLSGFFYALFTRVT